MLNGKKVRMQFLSPTFVYIYIKCVKFLHIPQPHVWKLYFDIRIGGYIDGHRI